MNYNLKNYDTWKCCVPEDPPESDDDLAIDDNYIEAKLSQIEDKYSNYGEI